MDNLRIYEASRKCPPEALRPIQAGKLKGKSDINPMWRIKQMTMLFGPCGIGWKTEEEKFWTTPGANGEVISWCSLKLFWWNSDFDGWSEPVFGIGGSMMVDTQKGSLTSNDDAFKMAYTDAISVACKALGFAADVYWEGDATKYTRQEQAAALAPKCQRCGKSVQPVRNKGKLFTVDEIIEGAKSSYGAELCWGCMKELNKHAAENNAKAAEGEAG